MLNKDKLLLNPTELTGILGKNEIEKLSKVLEEKAWKNYREKYRPCCYKRVEALRKWTWSKSLRLFQKVSRHGLRGRACLRTP